MTRQLLERTTELAVLDDALDAALAGQGSVALILGEAGIGKTSLLRSFEASAATRARVLSGACDDLMTPRTLGPIRDASAAVGGRLASALAAGNRDDLLVALREELSDRARPTVLLVEDVQWADDATLDVLRYLSRRITELPAMLLISFRTEEVGRDHPAHQLIGALGGEGVHRLRLPRLSRAGVALLSGGTAATSAPLYRLTGGNPFFVSEVLAARGDDPVPLTVVDAVLGRVHQLEPATQAALEQLSVVPSGVDLALARALLGDLTVLAPAERRGMIEVRPDAVAFRHELSRRAVEGSLPASQRMQLNGRVLDVLRSRDHPDLSRIVHHAVEAGADAIVVEYGSRAAEQAAAAGAHRQEIRFYDELLARSHLVTQPAQAEIRHKLTLSLFLVGRMDDALAAGRQAVLILEKLGEPAAVGEVLSAIAPIYWVTARSADALTTGHRAVDLLRADGQSPRLVFALLYLCLLMTATGELQGLQSRADEAFEMAESVGVREQIALSHTVRGRSAVLHGDRTGIQEMRQGLAAAIAAGSHVFAIISYVVIVQDLWDLGEFYEVERVVEEGLAYTRVREMDFYAKHLVAHQAKLQALRGDWRSAEATLRELVGARSEIEPGSLRYALPDLALIAIRRDCADAAELMDWCQDFAERAAGYYDVVPAALVAIESAWLSGRPELADAPIERILRYDGRGLQARHRGELQRWLQRLGKPFDAFPDCPEVFAAGLRGDWRAAAASWQRVGAPYQQALELVESGHGDSTLAALQIFDSLGAGPAVRIARSRLRELGVSQVPRGPTPTTRSNPAGLTDRQIEILTMLSSGSTNAEIAARLVVSVRTVDHHVSAVLQKLGLTNRRQAGKAAAALGLVASDGDAKWLAAAGGR